MDAIRWTEVEMIEATVEYWGDDAIDRCDCRVIRSEAGEGPCLIVLHGPTGRTSDEAGDGGRWTLDGLAFGDRG